MLRREGRPPHVAFFAAAPRALLVRALASPPGPRPDPAQLPDGARWRLRLKLAQLWHHARRQSAPDGRLDDSSLLLLPEPPRQKPRRSTIARHPSF
eukprot:scaffold30593_cov118-Isochrysis_galbana.AAC.2